MDEIKFELIWSLISSYSLKILGSIAILLIGKWLVAKISNLISKLVISSRLDETLSSFLLNIIKTLLMAFVIIAAIANLGVETSMFVAALGAIGLAIGMAFKDTFSNIGAGFLIIFLGRLSSRTISRSQAYKAQSKRSICLAPFCVQPIIKLLSSQTDAS